MLEGPAEDITTMIDTRTLWVWIVLSLVCGLLPPVLTQAQVSEPDRTESHRVPADFMSFRGAQWLERAERVAEERPDEVLETMSLEPGDVVADIGCGSGYYARRIAPHVAPAGRVYCVDIQPEMLDIMRDLAAQEGVDGVVPVLGTPADLNLPAGDVDWIILADVYHEMSDYEAMLAGMLASLAPGGRVALLEYRVEDGTGDHLKADHAMSVRQVLAEWLPAGFALVDLHEFLPGQHLFILTGADDATVPGARVQSVDLFDAMARGLVEAEVRGRDASSVTINVRNLSGARLVVTSPVGMSFVAPEGRRDMVARRDGWVRLFDDEPLAWQLRTVGRQRDLPPSGADETLVPVPPGQNPQLSALMYAMQVGTYRVADSPLLYIPRAQGLEQAAVWIAEADPVYDEIADEVGDDRLPAQYAVAFALVYCDFAGVDVTATRVWADHERIFGVLRDPGLSAWHQLKTAGR